MSDEAENKTYEPPVISPAGGAISGHFALREELGEGSSGTVYRAVLTREVAELPVGSEVAVKFVRGDLLADPAAQAQLEAEGELGKRVRSPKVVRIYAIESLQLLGISCTYLVMELVRGHSLREVLATSGSVVEELARRIGIDASQGLQALHDLGLVHRDIKPENLALTEDGDVKVMDLGLARRISGHGNQTGSGFYGSLSYAAPEVLSGAAARPQSDLYSLGVVLFEIVTGHHPFATGAEDADAVINAHLRQPPPRPSHFKPRISAFLEQLILDLLAKNPAARPRSAGELATTLARGEDSLYWQRHERRAPLLASLRRLRTIRSAADAPFVGRRNELRELDDQLRRVLDGKGQVVSLTGPNGVGRRRMLDEWLEEWFGRREDLVFLGAEAKGGAGIQRAAPFTDFILEWFLRGDRTDSPLAQTRLAARLAAASQLDTKDAERLAALCCGADAVSTPEERADLLARQLIAMRPSGRTLILRIDQADRLSTTAELVVRRLTEEIAEHRILMILVSQEGPASRRLIGPGVYQMRLQGLSEASFLELAHRMFAPRRTPVELLRRAHATLSGSPGHLIDALAELARERRITGRVGDYRLVDRSIRDLRPARSLIEGLRERFGQLTQEQRYVHLAAAVLGESFPLADLAAVVGQSELAVLETLSVFEARIIVTNRGTGRFRHRDFRKELMRSSPPAAKRQLHRTAAWVIEDRGAPALEVGVQLSRAGEHTAAIAPLLEGLAHLTATGSRQSSRRIRDRLRVHFAALPESEIAASGRRAAEYLRFLFLSARTDELIERPQAAFERYRQVAGYATQTGNPTAGAAALVAAGLLDLGRGKLEAALASLAEAEDRIARSAIPTSTAGARLRATGLGARGRALGYLGRCDEALQSLRTALDVAASANQPVEASVDTPADPPAEAPVEAPAEAAVEPVHAQQFIRLDEDLVPHLHIDLARLEALRGDFVDALRSLDTASRLVEAVGSNSGRLRVQLHRGHILATLGSRRQARALLRSALELARRLSNPRGQARAHLFLGELAFRYREPERALRHFDSAIELSATQGDQFTRVLARIYSMELDRLPPDLEREVRELGVPELQIAWLLAAHSRAPDDRLLQQAVALQQGVTLPLHLQRRLLYASGRADAARSLEQGIASQLPSGTIRRRFLAFVK